MTIKFDITKYTPINSRQVIDITGKILRLVDVPRTDPKSSNKNIMNYDNCYGHSGSFYIPTWDGGIEKKINTCLCVNRFIKCREKTCGDLYTYILYCVDCRIVWIENPHDSVKEVHINNQLDPYIIQVINDVIVIHYQRSILLIYPNLDTDYYDGLVSNPYYVGFFILRVCIEGCIYKYPNEERYLYPIRPKSQLHTKVAVK